MVKVHLWGVVVDQVTPIIDLVVVEDCGGFTVGDYKFLWDPVYKYVVDL